MPKVIDRDRAYYEWLKQYNLWRPDEPDEPDEKVKSAWKTLLEYAENSLHAAFDAGYEACKQDVSNL